jgi:hypothetical protein
MLKQIHTHAYADFKTVKVNRDSEHITLFLS